MIPVSYYYYYDRVLLVGYFEYFSVPERYYMIVIALLALGTLALALCDANLDDGKSLCWNLLMVAAFVGPLQPISTRLG